MKQALKPIRRRIRALRCVKGLFWGLLLGAGACLVLTIVSFFVPIEALWRYLVLIICACPLVGMLVGFLWPISLAYAARRADACGLKERSLTALSLQQEDGAMVRLQRADAEAALAALPVKEAMPVTVRKQVWIPLVSAVVVTCVLLLVPNPQHAVLRARDQVRQELRAQADEVEKEAERMADEGLTPEELQELRRITADMARDLRQADDKREALEALDERQKDMERLMAQVQDRQMQELSSALDSQSGLKGLSQALQSGSESEMQAALESIAEMMASQEGLSELAEQLAEAAEGAPSGEAQESLSASAASAASGNAQQSLSQLAGAMASASSSSASASAGNTGANLAALARMARSGVAQAGGTQGAGSGQGQGSGSGSGTGAGQGGQGQGGGGGAGMGTTQQDAGYTSGMSQSGQGMGSAASVDRVGEYERIYDPTRIGGDNEASFVQGTEHEGETQQSELGPGMGDMNGSVPYNQVIGTYQEAASQAMRRTALPTTLQEWVQRYFSSLLE